MEKKTERTTTITVKVGEKDLSLKFKSPNKLIYKLVIDTMTNDTYEAMDILFDNLETTGKYKDDFATKILFFPELNNKFLDFIEYEPEFVEGGFNVKLGKKLLKVKYPDRDNFKELFNLNIKSTSEALLFVLENMVEGGELTLKEMFSLKDLPTIILFQKQVDFKKK